MSSQMRCRQSLWIRTILLVCISCLLFISYVTGVHVCGQFNPNNNTIDLSEPPKPPMFHDLTSTELIGLREHLERDPKIKAVDPRNAKTNTSFICSVDLLLPPKADALKHLDHNGPQPPRAALVVMCRGDKTPPVVEEYECSPLPDVKECNLLNFPSRRNPVEFTFRPYIFLEFDAFWKYIVPEIDLKIGHILVESYGTTCRHTEDGFIGLNFLPSNVGSGILKDPTRRLVWYGAAYNFQTWNLHMLDLSFLIDSTSSRETEWFVDMIWYSGQTYNSLDELVEKYDSGRINKTKITPPVNDENLYSSLKRRGKPFPPKPQRQPKLVEPDGKRYSVKNRQVHYNGWSFNFRSSMITGPAIYDVRFNGERIAYEAALSEIVVSYAGFAPFFQTTNYADSGGESLGLGSRALIPGADCPDTATLISNVFMSQRERKPHKVKVGFCLFENTADYPLRRYLSYHLSEGPFYSGIPSSALVLRAALAVGNYNYIVDFSFHTNGVIALSAFSTGFIQSQFYTELERPYGFHIHDHVHGPIHHHLVIFKIDLDIINDPNTYEVLDITQEKVNLTAFPGLQNYQLRYGTRLIKTEQEAALEADPAKPKYYLVRNPAKKTRQGETRGYRVQLNGMTKVIVKEGEGNEPTYSWSRHQLYVTRQKDDEISASSIYAMVDSYNPVVNFTRYYANNESIVNKDIVLWVPVGLIHIPHTEDIPVTTTNGNRLDIILSPYNFFEECPSMGSRDAIYVELKDRNKPELGVKVERYGNSRDQCLIPKPTLEEDVELDPEVVLQYDP